MFRPVQSTLIFFHVRVNRNPYLKIYFISPLTTASHWMPCKISSLSSTSLTTYEKRNTNFCLSHFISHFRNTYYFSCYLWSMTDIDSLKIISYQFRIIRDCIIKENLIEHAFELYFITSIKFILFYTKCPHLLWCKIYFINSSLNPLPH